MGDERAMTKAGSESGRGRKREPVCKRQRNKRRSLRSGRCRWRTHTGDRKLGAASYIEFVGMERRIRESDKHREPAGRQSYDCADPAAEMKRFLQRSGFEPERTAAMLTAANIRGYGRKLAAAGGGPAVCAWVTAGLSNRSRAGSLRASDKLYPGTINTIVVIDGALTEAALVNAVITATEAKAAALQDMGVLTDDGLQATGTTTDAVIIAAVPRGGPIRYAGPATTAGAAIGAAVYEATRASLRGDLGGR